MEWYGSQNYESVEMYFEALGLQPNMLRTSAALLFLRDCRVKYYVDQNGYSEALDILEKNLHAIPENINSLYNAGILGYITGK